MAHNGKLYKKFNSHNEVRRLCFPPPICLVNIASILCESTTLMYRNELIHTLIIQASPRTEKGETGHWLHGSEWIDVEWKEGLSGDCLEHTDNLDAYWFYPETPQRIATFFFFVPQKVAIHWTVRIGGRKVFILTIKAALSAWPHSPVNNMPSY